MEIILKQDITNLGYKDDTVKVKNGYANNFLIPKGMATMATPQNKKIHAENMKQKAVKLEKQGKEAQSLADMLQNINVKIGAKAATTGKIFGSMKNIGKNTVADDNIHAKTGYITRVRSYTGYARTKTGKDLAFAIIVNNFNCSPLEMKKKIEKLMVDFAELSY